MHSSHVTIHPYCNLVFYSSIICFQFLIFSILFLGSWMIFFFFFFVVCKTAKCNFFWTCNLELLCVNVSDTRLLGNFWECRLYWQQVLMPCAMKHQERDHHRNTHDQILFEWWTNHIKVVLVAVCVSRF